MIKTLLLVGAGGFIGSIARYLTSTALSRTPTQGFPTGTFTVNLLGCLVIGFLAGMIEHKQWLSADARLFLMVGLLGGFTTFSSYGLETLQLIRADQHLTALAYALLSIIAGVLLAALGFWLSLPFQK